jgi:two-component system response regulator DesR
MTKIRLLLAEDQAMVRGALVALLELEGDLEVVAQVGRGDEIAAAVAAHRPDVALLDIELPGLDGIAAAGQIRKGTPSTRVLMLTTFGRPGYLRRAMEAGASGFLVKDGPASELAAAIRRIVGGERVVDPQLAADALMAGDNPLTPRERDVLRAAADGSTVTAVSQALHLSEGTVRNYLSSGIGKTGAANRIEAARRADELGWL